MRCRRSAAQLKSKALKLDSPVRLDVEEDPLSEPSVNSTFRLLGGGAAGDKPPVPLPPRPGAPAAVPTPAPPSPLASAPAEPIFLADSAEGADVLETAQFVQPLAQLCVAPQVQTPFLAAIAGSTGAGKTFALRRLAQTIERLGALPAAAGDAVLERVVVANVDAAAGAAAPVAIASAAYAALDRDPGGVDYSSLLDESGHAGGDPLRAAQAASDRHDEIVRKLEAERSQRDDIVARQARLGEALLYDTPGSRIDVFARANRGTIEARLRRFGLAGSDAGLSYRDLVRDLSGVGTGGRASVALRSVSSYGSQVRLLIWAIVAFALAFGVRATRGETMIALIARLGDWVKPFAAWTATHEDWFDRASEILFVLGALALALNLWRALGFSSLLFRGLRLLKHEVRERRGDLEARAARLNQRVAALSADAETAAKNAEAASRRAGRKASARAPGPDFLEAGQAAAAARAFLAALSGRIGQASSVGPAPDRLVLVIDNLDSLSPEAAIGWIEAAQSAIGPGCVAVLALDPTRLVDALGGPRQARRGFEKWLQLVVNLPGRHRIDGERLVARLLSTRGQATPPHADAKVAAALAQPLSNAESALLTALAPLAAHSPRDAKRFLNAYRLARCSNSPAPVMALMLAVAFADDECQAAVYDRIAGGSGELVDVVGPAALVNAVKSARAANNGAISLEDARAAAEVARRYALSL
jgi:KAP family P-loop domain